MLKCYIIEAREGKSDSVSVEGQYQMLWYVRKEMFPHLSLSPKPSKCHRLLLHATEVFFLKVARELHISRCSELFSLLSSTPVRHSILLTIFSLESAPLNRCDSTGPYRPTRSSSQLLFLLLNMIIPQHSVLFSSLSIKLKHFLVVRPLLGADDSSN